jgi:hypothetical protein
MRRLDLVALIASLVLVAGGMIGNVTQAVIGHFT